MNDTLWWMSEDAWRKIAVVVTAVMSLILIFLTFDTLSKIEVGSLRVPGYDVINRRIHYTFNEERKVQEPIIGGEAPLFGKKLTAEESEALVTHGKKVIQGRNCINCHTLLGNGSYYAPDLTKAWLDPAWGAEAIREQMMVAFLKNPQANARTFGSNRQMPNLKITDEEARAIVAFLKWMSSIDTNGFPYNFKPIAQQEN